MLAKFHLREIAIFLLMLFPFLILAHCNKEDASDYERARSRMVENQLKARGVKDKRVLETMGKVPRHLFVPEIRRANAYKDSPLLIGYGQTISQPYIVAYMTEAALLRPGDKVLEIGTGSGYQAAVLAKIVDKVYTIEIVKPLAEESAKKLKELGYNNIFPRYGDGYKGWPEEAPFDAIVVTAAPPQIPQELVNQLKVGGRMVIPVGAFYQELIRITKTKAGIEKEILIPVRFVPMVHGNK